MADPWQRLHPARQVRLRHAPGGSSDPSPQSSSKSQYQLEIVKKKKKGKMLKIKKGSGGGGGGEGEVVKVNRYEWKIVRLPFWNAATGCLALELDVWIASLRNRSGVWKDQHTEHVLTLDMKSDFLWTKKDFVPWPCRRWELRRCYL